MIAFTKPHTYFKNLNTELLGLSVDSNSSHLAWVYYIYCKTGIKVSFLIIADRKGEIEKNRNGMSWYLSFKKPSEKCIEENEKKKLE